MEFTFYSSLPSIKSCSLLRCCRDWSRLFMFLIELESGKVAIILVQLVFGVRKKQTEAKSCVRSRSDQQEARLSAFSCLWYCLSATSFEKHSASRRSNIKPFWSMTSFNKVIVPETLFPSSVIIIQERKTFSSPTGLSFVRSERAFYVAWMDSKLLSSILLLF